MAYPYTDYTLYQQALSGANSLSVDQQASLLSEKTSFDAYLTNMTLNPQTTHASPLLDKTFFDAFVLNVHVRGAPDLAAAQAATAAAATAPSGLPTWLSGDYTFGTTNVPKLAVIGGGASLVLLLLASSKK